MRFVSAAAAAVAVLAAAACGGDSHEPLSLAQRVATGTDAPGSKPDPRETRETATGARNFARLIAPRLLIDPTQQDQRAFGKTGFVAAVRDTRFFPGRPGAAHTGKEAHEWTLAMRFREDDGAETALGLLHRDSLRPCPEKCAFQVAQFDVGDVPGALGVRRYVTKESLRATGDTKGRPFDEYEVQFTDGAFLYEVVTFGPPADVSAAKTEEIAKRLYDRVKDAPAPGS